MYNVCNMQVVPVSFGRRAGARRSMAQGPLIFQWQNRRHTPLHTSRKNKFHDTYEIKSSRSTLPALLYLPPCRLTLWSARAATPALPNGSCAFQPPTRPCDPGHANQTLALALCVID